MFLKKLNINFYKKIKRLINKNGFEIPNYKYWRKLWNANSNVVIGEGIFKGTNLVGYHSFFEKKIIFKGKVYNLLVSSNWNVDKNFRNYSLNLINSYFNKKADLFLTTTANYKVSEIWKSYGAKEVNNSGCKNIYFKIINHKNLINVYLNKKKSFYINYLKPILTLMLFIYDKLKFVRIERKGIKLKNIKEIDDEIEKFNFFYEKKNLFPCEKKSKNELKKYLDIIKYNKREYTYKIYFDKSFIGYAILVKENIPFTKYKRMHLAVIRLKNNYFKFIDEIFESFTEITKKNDCIIIEFRNLNFKILKYFNKKNYYCRTISNNPYLIKFNSKKSFKFRKYAKSQWETTYLDGDCLL